MGVQAKIFSSSSEHTSPSPYKDMIFPSLTPLKFVPTLSTLAVSDDQHPELQDYHYDEAQTKHPATSSKQPGELFVQ